MLWIRCCSSLIGAVTERIKGKLWSLHDSMVWYVLMHGNNPLRDEGLLIQLESSHSRARFWCIIYFQGMDQSMGECPKHLLVHLNCICKLNVACEITAESQCKQLGLWVSNVQRIVNPVSNTRGWGGVLNGETWQAFWQEKLPWCMVPCSAIILHLFHERHSQHS